METLDLEFNDYVTNIFVFTIIDKNYQYYFSDKSDWLMDGWFHLHNSKNVDFLKNALEYLESDQLSIRAIKKEFERLSHENKVDVIETHMPMLYVDFDKKLLKSRYYEQPLHFRTIEDWVGSFDDFLNEIPKDYQYWDLV
ncbi:MAG: hypothetical protein AAF806_02495 [Bacteroidota bacterium]